MISILLILSFICLSYSSVLPNSTNTTFSYATLKYGGKFIAALGSNGQIFIKFQENEYLFPWTDWIQLTHYCPSDNDHFRLCNFNSDPALGINTDGRLEIFIRLSYNMDLWQLHMRDPWDGESWTEPRESFCTEIGTTSFNCKCAHNGLDGQCTYPNIAYWSDTPAFVSSNPTMITETNGALTVMYRRLDGKLGRATQHIAGLSNFYNITTIDIDMF